VLRRQASPAGRRASPRRGPGGRARRGHLAAIPARRPGHGVTRQAGELPMSLEGRAAGLKVLVRDRDARFGAACERCCPPSACRSSRRPPGRRGPARSPNAGFPPARRARPDRMPSTGQRQLPLVLDDHADHHGGHRPRRALCQGPPVGCRVRLPRTQLPGSGAGNGSAAWSTNTPRSH